MDITGCIADALPGFEARLENHYREKLASVAIMNNGGMLRLYKSETTWTIIVLLPPNLACFLAAGDDWKTVTPKGNES